MFAINEESVNKDVELFSDDSPLFTKEVNLNNAEKMYFLAGNLNSIVIQDEKMSFNRRIYLIQVMLKFYNTNRCYLL